ncbi:MAG: NAD-dependent epimerase/dehydratase family protein [Sarcina sp.]
MKILITGVYGIVGSYLSTILQKEHEIIGIGRRKEYQGCDKYYSCDITNKSELKKIFEENTDVDFIIHCAALAHNKGNDLSKDNFMKVNFEATKYISDIANKLENLKNFIFISTISVYGEEIDKDIYLETDKCNPRSPYAIAKRKSEEYIIENCKKNYTILRLAPVYSNNFRLNIERRTSIRGIPYKVGDGMVKLSLCNITKIIEVVKYIINNYDFEKFEIYNISDLNEYNFNNLLAMENKRPKIILPKILIKFIYILNKKIFKKQFLHENSIKLLTNNIYSSQKFHLISSRREYEKSVTSCFSSINDKTI